MIYCVAKGPEKFEGIFLGEGIECEGTYARVTTSAEVVTISEEDAVEAIASAVTEAVKNVDLNQTAEAVYGAADVSQKLILEVVASAVASVSGEINSVNEGCWAIAFGQAEAVAIANATVSAVAQAFAQAQLDEAVVQLAAKSIENDLQVAVEQVVLFLADGAGFGVQKQEQTVIAKSKATAINCALGKAFASIVEGESDAIALAQAGCVEELPLVIGFEDIFDFNSGCTCNTENDFGGPNLCGQWGDKQNGDYICYVQFGDTCWCGQPSKKYEGQTWRYCGLSLEKMYSYLGNENLTEPDQYPGAHGYCPEWNYLDDELYVPKSAPTPSPSPSPAPSLTPDNSTQTNLIKACPLIRCLGDIKSCCGVTEEICTSARGRPYKLAGICESTGQQVWGRSIAQRPCACLQ